MVFSVSVQALIILASVVVLAITGCTSTTQAINVGTAGVIGCPSNEIKVTNEERTHTMLEWVAECKGKSYVCSSTGYNVYCADKKQ